MAHDIISLIGTVHPFSVPDIREPGKIVKPFERKKSFFIP